MRREVIVAPQLGGYKEENKETTSRPHHCKRSRNLCKTLQFISIYSPNVY